MFSIVQDVTYRNMLFIAVFPQFIATSAEEQTLQNILLDWCKATYMLLQFMLS